MKSSKSKPGIRTNYKWIIKIALVSIAASMAFAFASSEILGRAGNVVAFLVLIVFIAIGIAFDIIGLATTTAKEAPFHSMAAHRERGAAEALRLIKNAGKVSSFCNDVVGDVSGIVSGATAALITAKLMRGIATTSILPQLLIPGAVAGLTIGGKAIGKAAAINNSTAIVLRVGKLINLIQLKK
jgi:CBS domain containing-hemolysin-like protein